MTGVAFFKSRWDFYAGLGYPQDQSKWAQDFRDVAGYFQKVCADNLVSNYREICDRLLVLLEENTAQFCTLIAGLDPQKAKYRVVPVLQAMDVAAFIDTLLSLVRPKQFEVLKALHERYGGGIYHPDLAEEDAWRRDLHTALQGKLGTLSELVRWQLSEDLKNWLVPPDADEKPAPGGDPPVR